MPTACLLPSLCRPAVLLGGGSGSVSTRPGRPGRAAGADRRACGVSAATHTGWEEQLRACSVGRSGGWAAFLNPSSASPKQSRSSSRFPRRPSSRLPTARVQPPGDARPARHPSALLGKRAQSSLPRRVEAPAALRMALNFRRLGKARVLRGNWTASSCSRKAMSVAAAAGDDFEVGRAPRETSGGSFSENPTERAGGGLPRACDLVRRGNTISTGSPATPGEELAKVRFDQGRWEEADRLAEQALRHRDVAIGIPIIALSVRGHLRARPRRSGGERVSRRGRGRSSSHTGEPAVESGQSQPPEAELALADGSGSRHPGARTADVRACGAKLRAALGRRVSSVRGSCGLRRSIGCRTTSAVPYVLPWREAAEEWRRPRLPLRAGSGARPTGTRRQCGSRSGS